MGKIIPLHLLCWNTVLQTKPVWLLTLSCLDSQKTRIFSTECWHSYTQMKDKFAAATHLICRICNLAGLWTSPAAWWSSVGCSLWNAWAVVLVPCTVSCTTGALVLAKEGEGKLHMAGAAWAPFPRSELSHFFILWKYKPILHNVAYSKDKSKTALQKFLHELEIKVIPARDGLAVCIYGGGISEEGKYPSTPSWVFNNTL